MRTRQRYAGVGADGFSMAELIVVTVISVVVLLALVQALLAQRRFYQSQGAVIERNETIRHGIAVLGSAFREANLANGDVAILAANRVRVRMPYGLAVVCGTDNNGSRIGIVELAGRWTVGDSVLVDRDTAGVYGDLIDRIDPIGNRVPCTLGGGAILRLDQRVPDAEPGTAVRAFRSHLFEVGSQAGRSWLFRVDGPTRDLLLGPIDPAQGFQAWYEDTQGLPVASPLNAERVVVRVIAISLRPPTGPVARTDTLLMTFGGRNR